MYHRIALASAFPLTKNVTQPSKRVPYCSKTKTTLYKTLDQGNKLLINKS